MKIQRGDNRKRYRKGVFRYCWETGEWVCLRQSVLFLGWLTANRFKARFSTEAV